MKQKVALAGALIHAPRLLMLDEPLTGLDASAARLVKEILREQTQAGATIVMTTYLWYLMELDIASGIQGVLIYTITGAHTVMLVLAMLFVALMALRALGGQFTARQHDGITAAAVYWYAMVAVYALIWISIYVTK